MPPQEPPRPLTQRLLWFVGLWLLGVASLATLSLLLHLWIAAK
jgi:hypothetical protein